MRDLGKMMKQVQKLQQDVARLQEELKAERVEATAGGGVVRAIANGHGELQEITIDLSSSDFDPVLIVRGEGLAQSIVDDDGGPGCAARVSQAFLARGPYRILVNTTTSPHRQTGRFTLAISQGSQHVQGRSENDCSPAGAAASSVGSQTAVTTIRVGETINGSLTSSDSLYPDNSYFKFYQFTAPAGRPVTIDLASDDFDPVLIVRGSDLDNSIINDDGGPGCYARVSYVPEHGSVPHSREHDQHTRAADGSLLAVDYGGLEAGPGRQRRDRRLPDHQRREQFRWWGGRRQRDALDHRRSDAAGEPHAQRRAART